MMQLRGLVLSLLFLAGGARRNSRIDDSRDKLGNRLEVSSDEGGALIPGTPSTRIVNRADALREASKQHDWRAGHIETPSKMVGVRERSRPHRAEVALKAQTEGATESQSDKLDSASIEKGTTKAGDLSVPDGVESNPIFLDEQAMLQAKPFAIPPDKLILLAKRFLASDEGLGPDPDYLSDENFTFSSPKVGPLSKEQLVRALKQQAVNPLSKGFPDLKPEFYSFTIDPFESNRVWYVSRGRGTNTAAFPPFQPEPTGKFLDYPPQACSLTFGEDGLITKYTIAAVMDRFEGNTGGLGGLYGALYALGKPTRVRKRDVLYSFLRDKLPKMKKKNSQ